MTEGKGLTLPEIAKRCDAEYRTLHSCCVAEGLTALRTSGLDVKALELVAEMWRKDPLAVCPGCRSALHLADYSDLEDSDV